MNYSKYCLVMFKIHLSIDLFDQIYLIRSNSFYGKDENIQYFN